MTPKLFFFLLLVMHLQIKVNYCQTIHKKDLNDFVAFIPVVDKRPIQVSKGFYTYHTNGVLSRADIYKLRKEKGDKGELIVGIPKEIEQWATLLIPEKDLFLVMLHDLWGFERQNNVLTFWRVRGDSLEFDFLHPKTFVSGIGMVLVKEAAFFKDGSMLIILRERGGDAGDTWGSFIFLHYKKPDIIKEVYTKRYLTGAGQPYIELTYQLHESVDDLIVKFSEKYFTPTEKKWPTSYTITRIDSFFVNLSDIVAKNEIQN